VRRPVLVHQHFGEHLTVPAAGDLGVVSPELLGGPCRDQLGDVGSEYPGPITEELVQRSIGEHEPAVQVLGVDQDVGVLQDAVKQPLVIPQHRLSRRPGGDLLGQCDALPPQLQLADDLPGQHTELIELPRGQVSGDGVQYTQGSQRVTRGGDQRCPGVEADP